MLIFNQTRSNLCRTELANRRRWPCPIPYEIQRGYSNRGLIYAAINEVRMMTRVQPRQSSVYFRGDGAGREGSTS